MTRRTQSVDFCQTKNDNIPGWSPSNGLILNSNVSSSQTGSSSSLITSVLCTFLPSHSAYTVQQDERPDIGAAGQRRHGEMARWRDGRTARRRDGEMLGWWDGRGVRMVIDESRVWSAT